MKKINILTPCRINSITLYSFSNIIKQISLKINQTNYHFLKNTLRTKLIILTKWFCATLFVVNIFLLLTQNSFFQLTKYFVCLTKIFMDRNKFYEVGNWFIINSNFPDTNYICPNLQELIQSKKLWNKKSQQENFVFEK